MFRRETVVVCTLSAAIFLVVALASGLVARSIARDAALIAGDTLPGLVDAGEAIAQTQENWLHAHKLLQLGSAAERADLIHRISTNSNEGLWKDYGNSLYNQEERNTYQRLLAARAEFIRLRDKFFDTVNAGQLDPARSLLSDSLTPAYGRYLAVSRELFKYNASIGAERAKRVIFLSRIVPLTFAGTGVVIFGLGILLGLRGALSGLALTGRMAKPGPASPRVTSQQPYGRS